MSRHSRVERLWSDLVDPDEATAAGGIETTCQRCEHDVSEKFVRVFAEKNWEGVYGCTNCTEFAQIMAGAARPGEVSE